MEISLSPLLGLPDLRSPDDVSRRTVLFGGGAPGIIPRHAFLEPILFLVSAHDVPVTFSPERTLETIQAQVTQLSESTFAFGASLVVH